MADDADIQRFAAMIDGARRVLFITGAGVSADSGLPTYRGVGGMYEVDPTEDGMDIEDALCGYMLADRPAIVWKYIHQIEAACRGARPNGAHEVMAKLQDRVDAVWVLTQNVDGLHGQAGSRSVIEIHGNIHHLDCTAKCGWTERVEDYANVATVPRCPRCDAVVRPRVVLFNELLPADATAQLQRQCAAGFDLVVSAGTSSAFPYIAEPVLIAAAAGAATVEINPDTTVVSRAVQLKISARAEPTLQAVWHALR